jgi:ribosome maturation factor RimP
VKHKPEGIAAKLELELATTLESFGYELVQLKFGGRVGNQTLTVAMDKPGGVTSADCQYMASRLSVLLDVLDLIEARYTLVVSSPGVNRPLARDADFARFEGSRVRVRYAIPEGRSRTVTGRLAGVADGQTKVVLDDGSESLVPLSEVETANILFDWEQADDGPQEGDKEE